MKKLFDDGESDVSTPKLVGNVAAKIAERKRELHTPALSMSEMSN